MRYQNKLAFKRSFLQRFKYGFTQEFFQDEDQPNTRGKPNEGSGGDCKHGRKRNWRIGTSNGRGYEEGSKDFDEFWKCKLG